VGEAAQPAKLQRIYIRENPQSADRPLPLSATGALDESPGETAAGISNGGYFCAQNIRNYAWEFT
jgi:hypothetical protein